MRQNPSHRIPLHRLPHHPFLNPDLSIEPRSRNNSGTLTSTQKSRPETQHPSTRSKLTSQRYPAYLSRVSDSDSVGLQWPDHKHQPKRDYLSDTWKPHEDLDFASAARRVNSAPTIYPQVAPCSPFLALKREDYQITGSNSRTGSKICTPALTADDSFTSTVSGGALADNISESDVDAINLDSYPLLQNPKARRSLTPPDIKKALEGQTVLPISIPPLPVKIPKASEIQVQGSQPSQAVPQTEKLPMKLSVPYETDLTGQLTPLTTDYLTPQTQKVLKGQVTVLPSKSLLVDLREGERRERRKGNEVLVISPDGTTIKIHSAPHLSTPCCLVEPIAEYGLVSLPHEYVAQYSDASKVVNHMKQRIPKVSGILTAWLLVRRANRWMHSSSRTDQKASAR